MPSNKEVAAQHELLNSHRRTLSAYLTAVWTPSPRSSSSGCICQVSLKPTIPARQYLRSFFEWQYLLFTVKLIAIVLTGLIAAWASSPALAEAAHYPEIRLRQPSGLVALASTSSSRAGGLRSEISPFAGFAEEESGRVEESDTTNGWGQPISITTIADLGVDSDGIVGNSTSIAGLDECNWVYHNDGGALRSVAIRSLSEIDSQIGDLVTYSITITAVGGSTTATLTDTIPAGFRHVDGLPAGVTINGRQISFGGLITPEHPLTFSYRAQLEQDFPAGAILESTAQLSGAGNLIQRNAAVSVRSSFQGKLLLIIGGGDTLSSEDNLSSPLLDLIQRAQQASTKSYITTLVLLDGPRANDTYLYKLQPPPDPNILDICPNYQEPFCHGRYQEGINVWQWSEDTANPYIIAEFIAGAVRVYPEADEIILSLVGHGGGWSPDLLGGQPSRHKTLPGQDPLGGMLWDEHPFNTLSAPALGQALRRAKAITGRQIDLLYLDACSMAMIEVAYEVRDSVDYLLTSENTKWTSFPYQAHLNAINRSMGAYQIGQAWLRNEVLSLETEDYPFTYSLMNLRHIEELRSALDRLAGSLTEVLLSSDEVTKARIRQAVSESARFESDIPGPIDRNDSYVDIANFAMRLITRLGANTPIGQEAEAVRGTLGVVVAPGDDVHNNGIPWKFPNQVWDWGETDTDGLYDLAWGDVDGNGDPDLVVSNTGPLGQADRPSLVYLYGGGILNNEPQWVMVVGIGTYDVAWGDYDSNGNLDIVASNAVLSAWRSAGRDLASSRAWGDIDSNNDLGLAVGNTGSIGWVGHLSHVYLTSGGILNNESQWEMIVGSDTFDVAWGDYGGDGNLDIIVGNKVPLDMQMNPQLDQVHCNEQDRLTAVPVWQSVEQDLISSLVWGKTARAGVLDLAGGNGSLLNRLYRNDSRALILYHVCQSAADRTHSAVASDCGGCTSPDMVTMSGVLGRSLHRSNSGIWTGWIEHTQIGRMVRGTLPNLATASENASVTRYLTAGAQVCVNDVMARFGTLPQLSVTDDVFGVLLEHSTGTLVREDLHGYGILLDSGDRVIQRGILLPDETLKRSYLQRPVSNGGQKWAGRTEALLTGRKMESGLWLAILPCFLLVTGMVGRPVSTSRNSICFNLSRRIKTSRYTFLSALQGNGNLVYRRDVSGRAGGDGGGGDPPIDIEIFEDDALTTFDGFVIVDRRRAFITLKRNLSDWDKERGKRIMVSYAYANSDMGVYYWRIADDAHDINREVISVHDAEDWDDANIQSDHDTELDIGDNTNSDTYIDSYANRYPDS